MPNRRCVLTWSEVTDAADTVRHLRVAIDIDAVGKMVRRTVTHDQLTADMQRETTYGWLRMLSSLKSFLETAHPLDIYVRYFRSPFA